MRDSILELRSLEHRRNAATARSGRQSDGRRVSRLKANETTRQGGFCFGGKGG